RRSSGPRSRAPGPRPRSRGSAGAAGISRRTAPARTRPEARWSPRYPLRPRGDDPSGPLYCAPSVFGVAREKWLGALRTEGGRHKEEDEQGGGEGQGGIEEEDLVEGRGEGGVDDLSGEAGEVTACDREGRGARIGDGGAGEGMADRGGQDRSG